MSLEFDGNLSGKSYDFGLKRSSMFGLSKASDNFNYDLQGALLGDVGQIGELDFKHDKLQDALLGETRTCPVDIVHGEQAPLSRTICSAPIVGKITGKDILEGVAKHFCDEIRKEELGNPKFLITKSWTF